MKKLLLILLTLILSCTLLPLNKINAAGANSINLSSTTGVYKNKSESQLKETFLDGNFLSTIKFPDSPEISHNQDLILQSLTTSFGTNQLNFNYTLLDQVTVGVYTLNITDNQGKTGNYTLQIQPSALTLDSTSGTYVQGSEATIHITNEGSTNFVQTDKPYAKLEYGNANEVYLDPIMLDALEVGDYPISLTDAYGQTAEYVLTVSGSIYAAQFSPDNGTYLIGSETPLSTIATKSITAVSATPELNQQDWIVSGKTLTFNPGGLDLEPTGSYTIKATLSDNSVSTYNLTVLNNQVNSIRWIANLDEFNKNPSSANYQDFAMTSSAPVLSVDKLVVGNIGVPTDDYFIVGTGVVISKAFLKNLQDRPNQRITLNYNGTRSIAFWLSISSELPPDNTSSMIPCR